MTNFIDDVIDGKTKLDEIDDYVEKWHNSDSHCSVSEYLGMTEEEFFGPKIILILNILFWLIRIISILRNCLRLNNNL